MLLEQRKKNSVMRKSVWFTRPGATVVLGGAVILVFTSWLSLCKCVSFLEELLK